MHGQNIVRKLEPRDDSKLQVAEIFYTLQGEGPFSGCPATFIRLTGCNLRCWFCDTQWDDENDLYIDVGTVVGQILAVTPPNCNLFVLTGGEPLRQAIGPLVMQLRQFRPLAVIQVETAGTYWQDILLEYYVHIVVSPKTPKIHKCIYEHADAFKYVIQGGQFDPADGLPLLSTQEQGRHAPVARPRPGAPVYLSPCDEGGDNRENMATVARLAMQYGYRAGVQLHKILDLR